MMEKDQDDSGITLTISADIDLISAEGTREKLLAAISGTDVPIRLNLSDGPPTAPALQLILAARRSLQAADRFAGFGPSAAAQLAPATNSDLALPFTSVRAAA